MPKSVDKDKIRQFKSRVYAFARKKGRQFPWRETADPYAILVSEIMLQQTQTSRVVLKYQSFLKRFPTLLVLARAPTKTVLRFWSGLGYNRRALSLKAACQKIAAHHHGLVPRDAKLLQGLPGIGHYTARAVLVFAYHTPEVMIETNIRAVFIHHFFPNTNIVSDKELLPLIKRTLDRKNPKRWYNALMDYGSFLKASGNVAHRRSAGYRPQPSFHGSRRELRGGVVRLLLKKKCASLKTIGDALGRPLKEVAVVVAALMKEGVVSKARRNTFQIV